MNQDTVSALGVGLGVGALSASRKSSRKPTGTIRSLSTARKASRKPSAVQTGGRKSSAAQGGTKDRKQSKKPASPGKKKGKAKSTKSTK
jgi:hypothetical protein